MPITFAMISIPALPSLAAKVWEKRKVSHIRKITPKVVMETITFSQNESKVFCISVSVTAITPGPAITGIVRGTTAISLLLSSVNSADTSLMKLSMSRPINKIKECDGKIEGIPAGFAPDMSIKELSVGEYVINKKKASKNAPAFNLGSELYRLTGVDLLAVPGINHISALQLLSEIGFDMTSTSSCK